MAKPCKIVGPYLPVGDTEWRCKTHDVDAVLIDPKKYGAEVIRHTDLRCPVGGE